MSHRFRQNATSSRHTFFFLNGFSKLTILLFSAGYFLGFFAVQAFQDTLYASALALFQNTVTRIPSLDIDCNDVFFYSLKENLKFFLLPAFFSLTNVWHLYFSACTLYTGFSHGILGAFCVLVCGPSGIVSYLFFLLPQALLLVPLYLIFINHMELLHQSWFAPENNASGSGVLPNAQKRQLLLSKLPFLLLCTVLLLVSALAEGYANILLLKSFPMAKLPL